MRGPVTEATFKAYSSSPLTPTFPYEDTNTAEDRSHTESVRSRQELEWRRERERQSNPQQHGKDLINVTDSKYQNNCAFCISSLLLTDRLNGMSVRHHGAGDVTNPTHTTVNTPHAADCCHHKRRGGGGEVSCCYVVIIAVNWCVESCRSHAIMDG